MVVWKKLCSISNSICTGLNPRQNFKLNNESSIHYYVTVKEITSNRVEFSNSTDKISEEARQIINKRSNLEPGDILFSGIGTIGKVAYVDFPTYNWDCSESVFLIKPQNEIIKGKFLYYILLSDVVKKQYFKGASGAIMKGVRKSTLEGIQIPIPSLEEQKRIVGILDTFTDSIENLKQQIVQRRKQYEHYRDQLLDLEGKEGVAIKSLGELFTFKNGLNKGKEFFGKGKPIIMFTNVLYSRFIDKSMVKSKVDISDNELERINAQVGDVFFTRTSETREDVGYASVLIDDIENCTFAGFLIRARPTTQLILPKYCKYCFSTPQIRDSIVSKSSFTTRASLTGGGLSTVRIPIPPLSEQQRIVSILDTFEASISNLEAQLEQRQKQYEYYRNKLLSFEEEQ